MTAHRFFFIKNSIQIQHVESTKIFLLSFGLFDIKMSWSDKETAVSCKSALPDLN